MSVLKTSTVLLPYRLAIQAGQTPEALAVTDVAQQLTFAELNGRANQLARLGFSVDCLHGDLSQKERNQIMQNFRDGKLAILVATDVAARGIDVSDVDAVINYDVPGDNEHYTHRIGRTGRAKKEGVSYLFYVPEEKKRVQELLRLTRNTELCTPVHFDFNHERIVVEKKKSRMGVNIK